MLGLKQQRWMGFACWAADCERPTMWMAPFARLTTPALASSILESLWMAKATRAALLLDTCRPWASKRNFARFRRGKGRTGICHSRSKKPPFLLFTER